MVQTPEQKARRAAQRRLARQIQRGESPLGGEFRKRVEQALGRPVTSPPPIRTTTVPSQPIDYESIAGDLFASGRGIGEGPDQMIPLTYYPTQTSYPSRLPQNRHPRTKAAGYNRYTNTLAVQFWTNGALYYYYEVPPGMAREFRLTDSPGDYINDFLNSHPYERIE